MFHKHLFTEIMQLNCFEFDYFNATALLFVVNTDIFYGVTEHLGILQDGNRRTVISHVLLLDFFF